MYSIKKCCCQGNSCRLSILLILALYVNLDTSVMDGGNAQAMQYIFLNDFIRN